jgi:hypothetical protein
MWKQRAVTLCGCVAVLPLVIGCSTGVSAPPQAYAPAPTYQSPQAYPPTEAYAPAPAYRPSAVYAAPSPAGAAPASGGVQVYAVGPAAPAAIVVMLPGAGDVMTANPQLWAAQGFDVVTPTPVEVYRMAADEERAIARLIASAETMANAPIWLVGPSQVIETAVPQAGDRVSGVIVTSAGAPTFSCSESFSYYNSGTGAPPQVKLTRSGDCGTGTPGVTGRQPSVLQPPAARRPNASPLIETRSRGLPQMPPQRHQPRIIEASAAGKNLAPAAQVHRLAQLIKAGPPS